MNCSVFPQHDWGLQDEGGDRGSVPERSARLHQAGAQSQACGGRHHGALPGWRLGGEAQVQLTYRNNSNDSGYLEHLTH